MIVTQAVSSQTPPSVTVKQYDPAGSKTVVVVAPLGHKKA